MSIERLVRIALLRLRSVVRRADVERELDEELRYHIEQQTAQNIRLGMSAAAARTAALRSFGGVEYHKEEARDRRGTRWLEDLAGDTRFAIRSLRRTPGFAWAVILTLGLGIGANTAMFTVLRGTLLNSLPNRNSDQLIYLRQAAPGALRKNVGFSVPEVGDYRASKTISELAEYSSTTTSMPFTLIVGDGEPTRPRVAVVSGNYFEVMGVGAAFGRVLSKDDDGQSAARVAVLSYEFWRDYFGGDAGVIGRMVRINDALVTIVGIARPTAPYPERTELFVNVASSWHHQEATMQTSRTHRMSEIFARLAPGTTLDQARAELRSIAANAYRDHPDAYVKSGQFELSVTPLRTVLNERASLTFSLLMAAAALVLLIACANVANLTLIRGMSREREMVVRSALGGARARLRRLIMAENLVLALAGGVLAVVMAAFGTRVLVAFAAQFSTLAPEIHVDATVLLFCLGTSVLAAIALSFIPRIDASSPGTAFVSGGHRSTLGRGRQRAQRSLVVAQVALSVVLLAGAGLLVRTLVSLSTVQTGLRAEHVLTMTIPVQGDYVRQGRKGAENLLTYERIRSIVAALPGVMVAGVGSHAPLRTSSADVGILVQGRAVASKQEVSHASFKAVDAHYFAAAGITVLRGRAFEATDRAESPAVAILSRTLATQLFGDADPIGRAVQATDLLMTGGPTNEWETVIGVASDTRDKGLDGGETPTLYRPLYQASPRDPSLVVRTTADPTTLQPAIVRAIRDVYPRQVIEHVATIDQLRDEGIAPRRVTALLVGSFGLLAFIIAMVGVAGVLAFSVRSRIAEIGIRMSLGADASQVRRMVLRSGGVLLTAGVVIGVVGAVFATRLLRGMLFDVTSNDPATFGGVALLLVAVGLGACWVPAARAARVNPATALRAE
jgi:predicted permease